MKPSLNAIHTECYSLANEGGESREDAAFIAGMEQALKWVIGIAASPSEYLRMCDRVDRMH